MALFPKESSAKSIRQAWQSHDARKQHDRRSVELIERWAGSLEKFPSWASFWSEIGDWPNPTGKWSFLLLARICQSHGDPAQVWMSFDEIGKYESSLTGTRYEFSEHWGPHSWRETGNTAMAAAALLNFCDLCDISRYRFTIPKNELIRKEAIPPQYDERVRSFLHLASHQLGRVRIVSERIELSFNHRNRPDLLTKLVLSLLGPGFDLLHYGNHPKLKNALSKFSGITIPDIHLTEGRTDEQAWKDLETEHSVFFPEGGRFYRVNSELGGRTSTLGLERHLFHSQWFAAMARVPVSSGYKSDESDLAPAALDDVYLSHRLLANACLSGLMIEDVIKIRSLDRIRGATAVVLNNPFYAQFRHYYSADAFLAAIKIAKTLIARDSKYRSVRVAIKSNSVHRDLRTKDGLNGHPRGTIFIVIMDSHEQEITYEQMIYDLRSELAIRDSLLILCPPFSESMRDLDEGNRTICNIDAKKITRLKANCVSIEISTDGLVHEITAGRSVFSSKAKSPSQILFSLLIRSAGAAGLSAKVKDLLKVREHADSAFGIVVYLAILKLLDTHGEGVDNATLQAEYDLMQSVFARWKIPSINSIEEDLSDALLVRTEGGRSYVTSPVALDLFLKDISVYRDMFAAQVLVLFRILGTGAPYRIDGMPFFERAIPIDILFQVIDDVLSEKEHGDAARARMASSIILHLLSPTLGYSAEALWQVSKHISLICGPISSARGLIAFQMIYHLLRRDQIWRRDWFRDDIQDGSAPLLLASLEAIASHEDRIGESIHLGDEEIVRLVCTRFSAHSGQLRPGVDEANVLAFDVVYHYLKRNRALAIGASVLLSEGTAAGWHEHATRARLKCADSGDATEFWRALRSRFLTTVTQLSDFGLKRELASSSI